MEVVQNWELRARDVKYQIFVFYVGSSILLEFLFLCNNCTVATTTAQLLLLLY